MVPSNSLDSAIEENYPNKRMPHVGAPKSPRVLPIWIGMLVLYSVWGSTYLAIRFAVESLPPFLMASTRFLLAGTILYTWRRARGDPAPARKEWRSAAIIGLLLLVGGNGGVSWAEQHIPSGVTSLLVGTVPLWMALLDAVRPGAQRPDWRVIVGMLAGFAGVVVLIRPAESTAGAEHIDLAGIFAVLLGALLWSVGSLYGRRAPLPQSPLLATGMQMLAGGAGLLILSTLSGEWGRLNLGMASVRSLWGLLYLIVFGSLLAFSVYTWLLRIAPTPLVSTYAYVNPLVAVFLGHFLAGESLTLRIRVAAAVIVGSVALITSTRTPAPELSTACGEPKSAEKGRVLGSRD
jgi:drug/metabolite transporter (DMT)-like permease